MFTKELIASIQTHAYEVGLVIKILKYKNSQFRVKIMLFLQTHNIEIGNC